MTLSSKGRWLAATALIAALCTASVAHEGHDHGDEVPPAALPALAPRAEAASDLFELLAVSDGAQLVVWLDRFASNEPVAGARIEVEGQGWRAIATAQGAAAYRVELPRALAAGAHPLVFTVQAGADSDLLETTLTVPAARPDDAVGAAPPGGGLPVRRAITVALGVAAALAAAALLRWHLRHRRARTLGVASLLGAWALGGAGLWPSSAPAAAASAPVAPVATVAASAPVAPIVSMASGAPAASAVAVPAEAPRVPAASAAAAERPQRLPDGRVFLPKATQRRLALRTVVAEAKTSPRVLELVGEVVLDPNAAGRVQASQAGRLAPGPRGLPVAGQRVARGQVLALVHPTPGAAESATRAAERADIEVRLGLAERQWARARELSATVPQREADALAAEVEALRQRLAALATATRPEALTAPVAGIVATARATAGQVVEPRELLFEIVDPQRLLVETLVHDVALAASIERASLADSGVPLAKIGVAGAMRDAALPVLFRPQRAVTLALHQPVRVLAQSSQTVAGVPLPAAAVVRNPSNEPSVWLHERAELFRAVPVQVVPLDGRMVVVIGVAAGSRVVTDGASLLNQVR